MIKYIVLFTSLVLFAFYFSSCDIDIEIQEKNNILNNYRIIAHGLGGLDGFDYLNLTECIDYHYNRGTIIFEVNLYILLSIFHIFITKIAPRGASPPAPLKSTN